MVEKTLMSNEGYSELYLSIDKYDKNRMDRKQIKEYMYKQLIGYIPPKDDCFDSKILDNDMFPPIITSVGMESQIADISFYVLDDYCADENGDKQYKVRIIVEGGSVIGDVVLDFMVELDAYCFGNLLVKVDAFLNNDSNYTGLNIGRIEFYFFKNKEDKTMSIVIYIGTSYDSCQHDYLKIDILEEDITSFRDFLLESYSKTI